MRIVPHIARIYARNVLKKKFEPEIHYLPALLNRTDICLHIGASDGRHSYAMSPLVPQGHIHAFEPSSYTLTAFRVLNKLHGLRNVTTHHAAMSDTEGSMTLVTPGKSTGRLAYSYSRIVASGTREPAEASRSEDVRTCTIDAFVRQNMLPRVDFIRCDTEGAEERILRGGRETIARDLPTFLIEIHPVALRRDFDTDPALVRDIFLDLGYRMFILRDGQVQETREFEADADFADYFCIHPSRAATLPPGVFRDRLAGVRQPER